MGFRVTSRRRQAGAAYNVGEECHEGISLLRHRISDLRYAVRGCPRDVGGIPCDVIVTQVRGGGVGGGRL